MTIDPALIAHLITLGFSKNEALVYLATLHLGRGTVSEITRHANLNRTTGYTILDSLVEKGLVNVSGKRPKQEYVAESPEKLQVFLSRQAREAQNRMNASQELVPQLASIQSMRNRPRIRFYEGTEGLEEVYEDTLTSSEPIRAYANIENMHKTLPQYFPRYYKRRVQKGIRIRAIIPENEAGRERAKHDQDELRESVLIPPNEYYFSPEINIYDNKIMIASWREKIGIIIESNEIAEAMKSIYELAWNEAQRLHRIET